MESPSVSSEADECYVGMHQQSGYASDYSAQRRQLNAPTFTGPIMEYGVPGEYTGALSALSEGHMRHPLTTDSAPHTVGWFSTTTREFLAMFLDGRIQNPRDVPLRVWKELCEFSGQAIADAPEGRYFPGRFVGVQHDQLPSPVSPIGEGQGGLVFGLPHVPGYKSEYDDSKHYPYLTSNAFPSRYLPSEASSQPLHAQTASPTGYGDPSFAVGPREHVPTGPHLPLIAHDTPVPDFVPKDEPHFTCHSPAAPASSEASDPRPAICLWSECHVVISPPTAAAIVKHLKGAHFSEFKWLGPSEKVHCRWGGCVSKKMKLSSLGKHIASRHVMSTRVSCGNCGDSFSRGDSRNRHATRTCRQKSNAPGPV